MICQQSGSLSDKKKWGIRFMKEDRYKILKRLAQGGSGVTYLVWDVRLEKRWVMKCVSLHGDQDLRSVKQEIRALRQLHREGIPVLADVLYEEDQVSLVMEYMQGLSLEEKILQEGKMSESEAVRCALQIAALLLELHRLPERLVHGDLKPANLIWNKGKVALLDFGAAMGQHRENTGKERERGIYYTPGYVAPELLQGSYPSVESDVYGLGAVLFYLLTGQDPKRRGGICSIREENPALSRKMELLIKKCTNGAASERYHSIEEVIQELTEMAEGRYLPIWKRKAGKKREGCRYHKQFQTIQNILLTDGKSQSFVLNYSEERLS